MVGVLVAILWPSPPPDPATVAALARHDTLVITRPADLAEINALKDAAERARLAGVRLADSAAARGTRIQILQDSVDRIAATVAHSDTTIVWHLYRTQRLISDSLRVSLDSALVAVDTLSVSVAYWTAAYVRDSVRRERAEQVAADLRAVMPPKPTLLSTIRDRCGLYTGVDFLPTRPAIGIGCKIFPLPARGR